MKATIFDGGTRRAYTNEDAHALAPNTPYVWIDAVCDQLRDPEVLHLLDQMGFSDVVAAYTTRSTSTGMFQVFDDNMLGSTYVAADDPDDAACSHSLRVEQRLLRDHPTGGGQGRAHGAGRGRSARQGTVR